MSSEQYTLAWNEFQQAACKTFQDLYTTQELSDVTLACDDGMQVKAHKIILISCSQFFQNILLRNPHNHPLVYLKGVGYQVLKNIIRFIYLGQTDVDQDLLEQFMETAKELKIKGLCENETPNPVFNYNQRNPNEFTTEQFEDYTNKNYDKDGTNIQKQVATPYFPVEQGNKETENAVETINEFHANAEQNKDSSVYINYQNPIPLLKNAEGKLICTICDYQTMNHTNLHAHYLTKHGIGQPGGYFCKKCNQMFSSRGSLTNHTKAIHEGVRFPCDQCDFKGTQNNSLKKHRRSIHGV